MNLGERILGYRKKLGLSQEELGAKVGVSRQTVSKWEIGQTIPELEKMILLAREFETTIDELVKEENETVENEEQENVEKSKNNKIIKLFNFILVITIVVVGILLGVILYRYLMVCGLKNKFEGAGKEPANENGISFSMENYRIRENISKVEYMTYTDTKEITYYNLKNKYKKIYGNYYEPDRIEYLDYDTNEYYDIDCKNKTYKKMNIFDLTEETIDQIIDKVSKINVEILANFNLWTIKGKWELATDFDYNIEVIDQGYYINNYKYYEDFISFNVSKWRVNFSKYEYEDKVNVINSGYTIDYGVVDENLVKLPDLTDYTEIQN